MYHTRLLVKCDPQYSEILLAELAEANFDTFLENEHGFEAYVEKKAYDKPLVDAILKKYQSVTSVDFSFSQIPNRNWNEEWEKSYAPILVDDKCLIRASFHQPEKQYPYEIIITPKMSFGTGHHQTTYLMVKSMLAIDHRAKRVMDAGCGTAILSIMASKLGAKDVEAFDIDEWSVINGNENTEVNHCGNIRIQRGTIREVDLSEKFDIILANINKNVLLDELNIYSSHLQPGGLLLLSGFFTLDIPDLLREAVRHHLTEVNRDDRETWASLLLSRTTS
ncbi:MAG: 50S ribosomal protein L11 methyltransferase [Cyclobacteriaceae bacterium]